MIDCLYPCFKHWSDGGSIYIISDTHFDDSDCKLMDPNWPTAQEQIKILKKYIHKADTLIVLGDIGDPIYMAQLKCHKVLIKGNHDKGNTNYTAFLTRFMTGRYSSRIESFFPMNVLHCHFVLIFMGMSMVLD